MSRKAYLEIIEWFGLQRALKVTEFQCPGMRNVNFLLGKKKL